jgi:hypothetical protein
MAQRRAKDIEEKEETGRHKKAPQPSYDQLKVPDEGVADFQVGSSFETHAALLGGTNTDTQRSDLAIHLQKTYGNRYVQRLVESTKVQAKLTVDSPDDEYEREADKVADAVTRAPASSVQRQAEPEEEEEEEEEEIQPKLSENQPQMVSEGLEASINAARGSGQSLPSSVRTSLEPQFRHDFGLVHIHTDTEADRLVKQLGAQAFTIGNDIFFREGTYQPGSDSGKRLIAHELTHVVQQSAVPTLQRQSNEEESNKVTEEVLTRKSVSVKQANRTMVQTQSYATKAEAVAQVPAHVEPKGCFVWNDQPAPNTWRVIPGTGCAHWVAHQLNILDSPGCFDGYAIRVTQVIAGKTANTIANAQVGDIWRRGNHCGIVRAIGTGANAGKVQVEHCSSALGGVVTNWKSSGSCYR